MEFGVYFIIFFNFFVEVVVILIINEKNFILVVKIGIEKVKKCNYNNDD